MDFACVSVDIRILGSKRKESVKSTCGSITTTVARREIYRSQNSFPSLFFWSKIDAFGGV